MYSVEMLTSSSEERGMVAAGPDVLVPSLAVGTVSCCCCMSCWRCGCCLLLLEGRVVTPDPTPTPSSREECEEARDMGSVAGGSFSAAMDASRLSIRLHVRTKTRSVRA